MPTAAELTARRRITRSAAKRRPARPGPVPPAQRPTAIELAFAALVKRALAPIDAALLAGLPPELRSDAADGSAGPTPPLLTAKERARLLRQMQVALQRSTSRAALIGDLDVLAARTSTFTREQFARQLKASIGIDLTADPSMRAEIERFRAAALAQIRTQAAAKVERIGKVLADAGSGTRVETIAKRIREETEATPARAALIARDQVLTLNAEMTAARHQAAGIVQYVWRTSKDERVRPEHRALEGKKFRYDDPPVVSKTGDTGNPGIWYQCRCVAEPWIDGFDTEPATRTDAGDFKESDHARDKGGEFTAGSGGDRGPERAKPPKDKTGGKPPTTPTSGGKSAPKPQKERGPELSAEEKARRKAVKDELRKKYVEQRPQRSLNRVKPSKERDPKAVPRGVPEPINTMFSEEKKHKLDLQHDSANVLSRAGYDVLHQPPGGGELDPSTSPDYHIEGRIFDNYAPGPTKTPRSTIKKFMDDKIRKGQTARMVIHLHDAVFTAPELEHELRAFPEPGLEEVIVIGRDGRITHLDF